VLEAIANDIDQHVAGGFSLRSQQSVGGGCINSAYKISDGRQAYFVKLNSADMLDMFEAEAAGLQTIADSGAIKVPAVICKGCTAGQAYLVLEHLELGRGSTESQSLLGRQLAAMHDSCASEYGWERDNTIGSTPQINTPLADWVEFYRRYRLGYQYRLAARQGHGAALLERGERLMSGLDVFFADYTPSASLLHGDLWSGNYAFEGSCPVIFDPAVYYGDAEADLAMTELFGGFSADFYAAYHEARHVDAGYKVRKTLYNLYHILNHLNLFGSGYLSQATAMTKRLISEIN
jgi:fructosamine-3-kinase